MTYNLFDNQAVATVENGSNPWYMLWFRAVSQPTKAGFGVLLTEPNVTFRRAIMWLISASVIGGMISWQIEPGYIGLDLKSGNFWVNPGFDFGVFSMGVIVIPIMVLILHFQAIHMGGKGTLCQLSFLTAAYQSPLLLAWGICAGPASSMPGLFYYGNLVLTLIAFVMSINVIRATYGLNLMKSTTCAITALVVAYYVTPAIEQVIRQALEGGLGLSAP
jgi:hypothetical protein